MNQLASELPERVEISQLIKLKNKNKRLVLFDDDLEFILEIEFSRIFRVSVKTITS